MIASMTPVTHCVCGHAYEASEIDGASKIQQFFYVTLPQLIGVISLLFILRFIWNFNST